MNEAIYLPSDLASSKRTDFIREAREGGARLRDKDGTSLVMLPESRLELLESLEKWSAAYVQVNHALHRSATPPSLSDLGELGWLRRFDRDDQFEFLQELHDALLAARADCDLSPLRECLHEWQVTARELEDPLRKRVLLEDFRSEDYVEAAEPDDAGE
ncbi:DUF6247 family protein [Actinomadura hibisca]|uniref:DUF6247 family protein n=1 Tax=Actinomadura hibisca TaxID=68565 RepID=UPI000832887A|nr:DUF6247 family protein [Actinomadura hibisca]